MNCNTAPQPPQCRFHTPTTTSPAELASGATTRRISKAGDNNRQQKMIAHYFGPALSLAGLHGGPSTGDVFALLLFAQLIVQWRVAFHMPHYSRRPDRQCLTRFLGPLADKKGRGQYRTRHVFRVPTNADIDCFMNIAFHAYNAFQRGVELCASAVQDRLTCFKLTSANGGQLSLCFSFTEALQYLPNSGSLLLLGHHNCTRGLLPADTLEMSVREKLVWFTASTRTRGRFDRLFILLQIKHKAVLLIYDQQQQNLVAIDPQLPPQCEAPPLPPVENLISIHDIPGEDISAGMRVGVACVGELPMLCSFICNEFFKAFGGQLVTSNVCFDYFVVGEATDLGEEEFE